MRQRNDSGYPLLVAADPPFEVPADGPDATIDWPELVAGLTVVDGDGDDRPGKFTPADRKVTEVNDHLARADVDLAEATRILDAEAAGENRPGVVKHRGQVLAAKRAAAAEPPTSDPAAPADADGTDTPGERK